MLDRSANNGLYGGVTLPITSASSPSRYLINSALIRLWTCIVSAFEKIPDRAVTYCFITQKVGTDSVLNLLQSFIVEGNMEKGGCGYSPIFSIVGSKFTNITKKWNDFSNNQLVISRVFSWKSYGKSINFFNNELIFFHPGINNSLMMAITAFEKTTIIIFKNCKSPSSIIIKFLLLKF